MSRLSENPQVQRSIENLRKLGLRVVLEELGEDTCMLVIDVKSILEFLKKQLSQKVEYKKHWIEIDPNMNIFVIYLWKGEIPKWLHAKIVERSKT